MAHYFRDNRAWLKGLAVGCPLNEPLPDCPLENIRKLPIADRLRRVNAMTESDVMDIISHHKKCLEKRERELLS